MINVYTLKNYITLISLCLITRVFDNLQNQQEIVLHAASHTHPGKSMLTGCPPGIQGVLQVYRVSSRYIGCPPGIQGVLQSASHTHPGRNIHTGCTPGIQGFLHAA